MIFHIVRLVTHSRDECGGVQLSDEAGPARAVADGDRGFRLEGRRRIRVLAHPVTPVTHATVLLPGVRYRSEVRYLNGTCPA